ncbi:TIGR02281 family clan AA aspartic protease [Bradyrhizobium sp. AC87j1]|uniref:TIGR02281 family clan AA aspartic protease n=1 Tax=Bradyrhizobium sp. AC87j1 TaxID=2055894 RepID=UPI000CECA9EA|nr:TIGR02281 family clan AA aspartic protease [Bradyrhizobium sp. AC87j1]PPQ17492.1 TIGR02281 family clan AA aspartic protease [Bradyrhizobium sp. AC87j1]
MFRSFWLAAILLTALTGIGHAGYLTDNPDEVFQSVYARIGPLPVAAARDPSVWLKLEELKREPCDQKSIDDLAQWLDKLGYRRQAADGLFNFVKNCGAPLTALNKAVSIYIRLTDYPKAVEAADEYVRRAPSDQTARYLRGMALDGAGDYRRALTDYSDTIELFAGDKKMVSSSVFLRMANAYAALKQFCEATAPINRWVAFDPATRDTSKTQKIIADYERQGNCVSSNELRKESFPLQGQRGVVTAKAEINGVRGLFVLDTGASYVSVKSSFASKAKIADGGASEITLNTANGQIKAKLTKADKVALGKLEATNVPIAVQSSDDKSYGPGIDGLLGMSFLSRFEVQMARGSMEIRTRQPRK